MATQRDYEHYIAEILRELGITATVSESSSMPLFREAVELELIEADIYGRDQRLAPIAAGRWRAMRQAAERQDVILKLVSGFRSVDYQIGIWKRKLASGQSIQQILKVSAPPGYSEHHTGRAVDVTSTEAEPLTEAFEHTEAFKWLSNYAGDFGFSMTYPRGNRHGVTFEPWHWCFHG